MEDELYHIGADTHNPCIAHDGGYVKKKKSVL